MKHRVNSVFTFVPNILTIVDFLSQGKVITYNYNGFDSYYWDLLCRWDTPEFSSFCEAAYKEKLEPLSQFYLVADDTNFSRRYLSLLEERLKKDGKGLFMIEEFKNGNPEVEFRLYLAH